MQAGQGGREARGKSTSTAPCIAAIAPRSMELSANYTEFWKPLQRKPVRQAHEQAQWDVHLLQNSAYDIRRRHDSLALDGHATSLRSPRGVV